MTTTVSLQEATRHLTEMTRQASAGRPFVITENKKPTATLVGAKLFSKMVRLVEKYDQGLADSIAISFNADVQALLDASERDSASGNVVQFDDKLLR